MFWFIIYVDIVLMFVSIETSECGTLPPDRHCCRVSVTGSCVIRICYFTISKMSNVERNWHSVERKSDLHELKSVATMVKGKNSEIVSHLVVLRVCVMHNFPFLL